MSSYLLDTTLGSYAENKKYDGKYRQIKVTVKHDGVTLVHRRARLCHRSHTGQRLQLKPGGRLGAG